MSKVDPASKPSSVAIIGAGPAGLMAAESIVAAGHQVTIFEQKASVGRKFLMAGKGGLNISHSEPFDDFVQRYDAPDWLRPMLQAFTPHDLREWVHGLGVETFVGSSGRVFPSEMKAAPLLRAWVARLKASGVQFLLRHRWEGANEDQQWFFSTPVGEKSYSFDAVVLALGGASWAKLGADGTWRPWLIKQGVATQDFSPSNGGFTVDLSLFMQSLAGEPVKSIVASTRRADGSFEQKSGDLIITEQGVEGGVIYALSRHLRASIERTGSAVLSLDLFPHRTEAQLYAQLSKPMGKQSLSSFWRRQIGLEGVKAGLVRESIAREFWTDATEIAKVLKQLKIVMNGMRPIDEAISTAGGVKQDAVNQALMLISWPGVFCAGEMLDWDAPTGGYLLTACFAHGRWAGQGVNQWLAGIHKPA
ncbi:TIGR03862 family flavoprotein [Aquirhabdus parva]|uniref:TIGR03862 family flavoprotein n=1 Tax=Aquirhabdus parva TaxID=2283318 RepID=A0A345P3Y3_9GAMM|nr:TIGR03862 family flavoprotein [Aquirhabdus parva]AXI01992.1 TIGR03862 family flavoprotein [Aquirhabdus parva]